MNKKYKYLFKNVGLFSISNIGGRLLSFFLLPLYTNILTTEEYGTYDFYITTVSLLAPILTVSISDAVLRFSLDKNENKTDAITVGFRNLTRAFIIFAVLTGINYAFNLIPILNEYPLYLLLYFISSNFYSMLTVCARGLDKVADHAVAGLINTLSAILLNILFLVVLKLGISGYFLAYICAYFIAALYICIRIRLHRHITVSLEDKTLTKRMEKYSSPFILNSIAWWINNVFDRYIIIWLCGKSANGIYSIAYKIPSIINAFEAIFEQAWTLSAIKEFDDDNKDFYSDMYKLYNFGLVFACSALIILDKPLARLLYAKDFYEAWKYVPFLIISILFGSMGGFIGGIFSAAKKSSIFARTTTIGAAVNIIMNIILVKLIGPIGAAISTMVSFGVVWACRLYHSRKYIKLEINLKRDIFAYALLILQSVILVCISNNYIMYVIEALCIIIIAVTYKHELILYIDKFKSLAMKLLKERSNGTD